MRGSALIALLVLVACGTTHREVLDLPASGGAGGTAGTGMNVIMPDASAGAGDTFSPSGDCDFGELTCPDSEYFVDVMDGDERVRLDFPASSGCGDCTSAACVLFGDGASGCRSLRITFAACFGEDGVPPCLELNGITGKYTDAAGQVFDVSQIEEVISDPQTEAGMIEIWLEFTISDAQNRTVGADVRLCGSMDHSLVPC